MSFLGTLASMVEFLEIVLRKLAEKLKQTNTVEHANFIYAAIYSFSSKH